METYQQHNNQYYANIKAKLSRDTANRRIAGVCAGIGKYFNINVSLIRTIWFLLAFFGIFSAGISTFFVMSAYFALWLILPKSRNVFEFEMEQQNRTRN